jgi:Dienelactone hydrolase family
MAPLYGPRNYLHEKPVPIDIFTNPEARANFDLKQFNIINSKDAREGWMHNAAKAIKSLPGVKYVGAVGVPPPTFLMRYCWDVNSLFLIRDLAGSTFDACIIHSSSRSTRISKDFERVLSAAPWYYWSAERDQWFPDEQRDESKNYLEDNGVSVKLSVYEKIIHGFAVHLS